MSSPPSIPEDRASGNENRPKIGLFCMILLDFRAGPGGAMGRLPEWMIGAKGSARNGLREFG